MQYQSLLKTLRHCQYTPMKDLFGGSLRKLPSGTTRPNLGDEERTAREKYNGRKEKK